jgi:formylglycine-generating enzyme required for sulfatase activity
VADDDGAPSRVGHWEASRAVGCPETGAPAAPGRVCVPGGMSILGDTALVGDSDGTSVLESVPLVPVVLSPYWLDETEMTVGAYRALRDGGRVGDGGPTAYDPGAPPDAPAKYCTWTPAPADHEALPLNCIDWASARAVCQALGGDLPTEAQWEHAARGRGQQDTYPWGNDPPVTAAGEPACDRASYARASLSGAPLECPADPGAEPVKSHPADRSRDGAFDLGGSLSEMVLDAARSYADPCWGGPGLRADPRCVDGGPSSPASAVLRGGSFLATSFFLQAAVRRVANTTASPSPEAGFRCAYAVGAP